MMVDASTKQLIEAEYTKRAAFTRTIAEKLWREARLSHYTPEAYIQHHESCRAMRHYFPYEGKIPKHTLSILPTPEHPSRPFSRNGTTSGCPSCDVKMWDECLRKARVMTNVQSGQADE